MDVLAFGVFLKTKGNNNLLALNIHSCCGSEALIQNPKNKYDESLIRLLKSSLRISDEKSAPFDELQQTNIQN